MPFLFLSPFRMGQNPASFLEFVEANSWKSSSVQSRGSASVCPNDSASLTSKLLLLRNFHPALEPESHRKRIPALSEVQEGLT